MATPCAMDSDSKGSRNKESWGFRNWSQVSFSAYFSILLEHMLTLNTELLTIGNNKQLGGFSWYR